MSPCEDDSPIAVDAIADETLARRLARGERLIGVVISGTSLSHRQSVGADAPRADWLTDAMILSTGAFQTPDRIAPRAVQAGLAILMGVGSDEAGAAVTVPGAEIRMVFGALSFWPTVAGAAVANHGEFGAGPEAVLLGPIGTQPSGTDLALEACLLEVDGRVVDSGTCAAVSRHPLDAAVMATNRLAASGVSLDAGWLVVTDGLARQIALNEASRLCAHYTTLGTITVQP